jgi:molecular chaperone GrpE (heat shock protein)
MLKRHSSMCLCGAHERQRHQRQQKKRDAEAAIKAAEARTTRLQEELAAMRERATKERQALMEHALINKTMDDESSDEGTFVEEAF